MIPSSPLPLTFNTESTQQAVGDFYQLQRVSSLCFCPVIATCSSFLELCTPKALGESPHPGDRSLLGDGNTFSVDEYEYLN